MDESNPARPEPNGCMMADLMALTLGVAIAASLDWYSSSMNSNLLVTRVIEWIQKGSVAIVPLILARRMRFGGPLRPVEILPMMTATFLITFAVSRWPVFGLYDRSNSSPGSLLVNVEAYYVWELSELSLGALAALAFLLRRRRPPDWIDGLLLAVGWQLLTTWLGYFYQQWVNGFLQTWATELIKERRSLLWITVISTLVVSYPQYVVADLPLMVALVDLIRSRKGRMTWVVRASVVLSLPLAALDKIRVLVVRFDGLGVSGVALGMATSLALALWTESIWRRWLGLSANDPAPGSQASFRIGYRPLT